MMYISKVLNNLLRNILVHGDTVEKDDAKILESMGNHFFIDNPAKGKCLKGFIKSVNDGDYDLKEYGLKGEALAKYVSAVDNHEQVYLDGENSFVYSYPNRIFRQEHRDVMTNQFSVMLVRLLENLGSNRSVANIYNAFLDCDEDDIPCLNWLQATVRHGELVLHCMFRSNDIYGAWYGNMLFLTYLGLKMVEELNSDLKKEGLTGDVSFKGIDYYSTSAHVYDINGVDAWKLFKETQS